MPIAGRRVLIGLLGVGAIALLALALQPAFQSLTVQILQWQRALHRLLTTAIMEFSALSTAATWGWLLGVSFAYGVFHAAGPGHGKAVITTYLLSHDSASRRSALLLSLASSLAQGLTAITLVSVLVIGLGWVTREAMGSVYWVEQASFAVVTLLGVWLCFRAIGRLRKPGHGGCCGGHHGHHEALRPPADWRTALGIVAGVGIRPCTGAVLLLGAAVLLGEFLVGIAAVVVMSLGTALTVSALALVSVHAREWAQRWSGAATGGVVRLGGWAALVGGAIIVMIGASLLMASGTEPVTSPLLNNPGVRLR